MLQLQKKIENKLFDNFKKLFQVLLYNSIIFIKLSNLKQINQNLNVDASF